MKKWLLPIIVSLAIIGGVAMAQNPPVVIEPAEKSVMVVFYNKNTQDVVGYAPYDGKLEINSQGVKSSTVTMSGVNWDIVSYGFYEYQDIPKRYTEIEDGRPIEIPWKLKELNLKPVDLQAIKTDSQRIADLEAQLESANATVNELTGRVTKLEDDVSKLSAGVKP